MDTDFPNLLGRTAKEIVSGRTGIVTAITLHLDGTVSARVEHDRHGEWYGLGRLEFDILHAVSAAPFTQSPKIVSGVAL